jgi:hypothetical protein
MHGGNPARLAAVLVLATALAAPAAFAQDAPVQMRPFVDARSIIFSSLANEVGQLPTPTGGGFTYQYDPALGVFTRTSESFGSVFGERAETTGRGRFTFTVSYSRHTFDDIDGVSLRDGSLTVRPTFTQADLGNPRLFDFPLCMLFNPLEIREEISADVASFSALYGVTENFDVGVTVPILHVKLKERVRVRRSSFDADPFCAPFGEQTNEFRPSTGENTGIGDISLRAKYKFASWETEGARMGVATSLDVRLPSGDTGDRNAFTRPDANFQSDRDPSQGRFIPTVGGSTFKVGDPPLGLGIVRVKPQLILSAEWGAFALHGATGFELGTTTGVTNDFLYQLGADYTFMRRVTISADLLGRTALSQDRRRIRPLDVCGLFEVDFSTFPNICPQPNGQRTPGTDQFNNDPFANSRAEATRLAASFGVKVNPWGTLLLFANFMIPVNDAGLRDDLVVTFGGEWSF